MNISEQTITFAGESLTLTNQGVLFWEKQQALVLSDLHLGKAAHFRQNGIAIPSRLAADDLEKLGRLIGHYQARTVIITGDLFHAGSNKETDLLAAVTNRHPGTGFVLIRGNHDRLPAAQLHSLGISAIYRQLKINDIAFTHLPAIEPDGFTICGHLHPGVAVQVPPYRTLRLPCYVVTPRQIILPAFSRFTGLDTRPVMPPAIRYAFYEDGFIAIPET